MRPRDPRGLPLGAFFPTAQPFGASFLFICQSTSMTTPTPPPTSRPTANACAAPAKVPIDRSVGLEPGPDGPQFLIGRDPEDMPPDELRALGHEPMSPLDAIRLLCVDCCGGSMAEVRRCVSVTCPLFPFRMKFNPWRAPKSEAQRANARALGEKRRLRAEKRGSLRSPDETGRATAITPQAVPDEAEPVCNLRSPDDTQAD